MTEPVFRINAQPMLDGLDHLGHTLEDKADLLHIAGDVMVKSIHQTFREGGSPAGSWRPLYASTMAQEWESRGQGKRKRRSITTRGTNAASFTKFVKNKRILMGALTLWRSISYRVEPGENRVVIGSALKYARIHQLGGEIVPKAKKYLCFPIGGGGFIKTKRVVMPARPFIVLRPEDPSRLRTAFKELLAAG